MTMPNSHSHCSTIISFEILLYITHCIRSSFLDAIYFTICADLYVLSVTKKPLPLCMSCHATIHKKNAKVFVCCCFWVSVFQWVDFLSFLRRRKGWKKEKRYIVPSYWIVLYKNLLYEKWKGKLDEDYTHKTILFLKVYKRKEKKNIYLLCYNK